MKNQIFMALGIGATLLFPTTLNTHAETSETVSKTVDIQGDFVSFDDIVSGLEGEMTVSENSRVYQLNEQVFTLAPEKGYSLVNEQDEPFLLETSLTDETVLNVTHTTPILFNDELFVPISYVERLLGLTFKEGGFEKEGEILFKGEEFVSTAPESSDSTNSSESIDTDESDNSESEAEISEDSSTSSPSTSDTPSEKPKPDNNSTSSGTTSKPEPLTVKQVLVNQTSLKLEVGKTGKFNAVVDPFNVADASITWSSANTNIATVDNRGNVTAIAAGTTTLTATSNMNPKAKTTVTVTVTPPPVIVASSVSVGKSSVTLEVGGSEKVSAWVSPENTTNKGIQWSSENSSVATVDGNGNIVAKAVGTTRIVATATSNGNAKAYISVTVKAKPQPAPTPTPSTPIYTGSSVVKQLLNEGFYQRENNIAFWTPYEPTISSSYYDVVVTALNGQSGLDLAIRIAGIDWDNCFSYASKALNKVIPSGSSTIINAVKAGQSGTWNFDGRKVVVSFAESAHIEISGKQ